jgi:uncharacterized protein YndB with AHSA1/START domain
MTMTVGGNRTLPVPVEEAYAAWTDPGTVRRWWGPDGFSCPVAEMDVREGGSSLLGMQAPAEYGGGVTYTRWSYTRVDPPHRLEYVMRFADAAGEPITPAEAGVPAGVPDGVPHVVLFEPTGERGTRLTVTEYGYTEAAARDISQAGLDQCLDKLVQALGIRTGH